MLLVLCLSALAQSIHITPVDTIRPPFPDSLWEYTSVSCISNIGDINQDGYEDLGVSYRFNSGDIAYPYRVVLYMGNATGRFEPSWKYYFPEESVYAEDFKIISTIENIGDINGDGWEDIAIGMPGYGYDHVWNKGRVWVYFGGALMDTIPDWAWSAGDSFWYHGFGAQIAGVGDWDGDSYGDFAISAPWNDMGGQGQVYLVFGGNPPDTTTFIEWSGTESEESFGGNTKATDLNGDGLIELIISNQIGYYSDTLTFNTFRYSLSSADTISSITITGLEDWYGFRNYLDVVHMDIKDVIYSSIYGEHRWNLCDSFMLFKIEVLDDSIEETEIDLRTVFCAHDTSLVPMVWNLADIKDLTGDGIEELLCEYCYSKQNESGSYRLCTSGRFYVLDQSDSLEAIYISDSLFGCSSYLFSYSKTAVLDFNGDGRDEIFHSLISSYCAGNDWEIVVYTTGDWEGIEENESLKPTFFEISAYPNPFNSAVRITLDCRGLINQAPTVEIFDLNGRRIDVIPAKAGIQPPRQPAGFPIGVGNDIECIWQPDESLPSGVYLVRATIGSSTGSGTEQSTSKRIVYLK